jgi:hypothetical protein
MSIARQRKMGNRSSHWSNEADGPNHGKHEFANFIFNGGVGNRFDH